jgi:hypothetical protein
MDSYITLRSDSASPRAKSWIIAAIALILNWAAPGQTQFPRLPDVRDAAPGVSSGERVSRPGNLPRVQTRIVTSDTSLPKAAQSRLNAGSKPPVILSAVPALAAAEGDALVPSIATIAPLPVATRAFDARAPPRLMA